MSENLTTELTAPVVQYFHIRNFNNNQTSNRGGTTFAYYIDDNGIHFAYAVCSNADNFNKQTGRELAKQRLQDTKILVTIPTEQAVQKYIEPINLTFLRKKVAKDILSKISLHDLSLVYIKSMILDHSASL